MSKVIQGMRIEDDVDECVLVGTNRSGPAVR